MNVSKTISSPKRIRLFAPPLAVGLIIALTAIRADVVQMTNGDRYAGAVISVVGTNVIFQSEVQGRTVLPRDKVAAIYFRPVAVATATNRLEVPAAGDWLNQLRNSTTNSNLIDQVRRELLAGAGPEANRKFEETVRGLMGGTISMEDIRRQAQESVNQLRSVKEDLGEDGELIEGYLRILEQFLRKTEGQTKPDMAPQPQPAP